LLIAVNLGENVTDDIAQGKNYDGGWQNQPKNAYLLGNYDIGSDQASDEKGYHYYESVRDSHCESPRHLLRLEPAPTPEV
jgi:hypothetical protein